MSHNCLTCLCFKVCLVLSFRNTFATIRMLVEESSKWQSDCQLNSAWQIDRGEESVMTDAQQWLVY